MKHRERKLAIELHKRGLFIKDIAATLKVTDKTIRGWLKAEKEKPADQAQLIAELQNTVNDLKKEIAEIKKSINI